VLNSFRKSPGVATLALGLALQATMGAGLVRGPVAGINTRSPYLIYYGSWDSTKINFARNNYRLVILHPQSNITAANIATIKRGPDNIPGPAYYVSVLA